MGPKRRAFNTALRGLSDMMMSFDKGSREARKADDIYDQVPLETLMSYRPAALKDAINKSASELDNTPLVLADPQTFLTLAPDLPKQPAEKMEFLKRIREGSNIAGRKDWTASDGRKYSDRMDQEMTPGYDRLQRLWFNEQIPGELRVLNHEGRHRSTEMQKAGIEDILIQLQAEEGKFVSSPSFRNELNDVLQRQEAPVLTQLDNRANKPPRSAGRAGSLWKLLGLPAAAIATEEE